MAIKPVEILITAKDKASEVFGGLKATAVAAGVAIAGYFGVQLFRGAVAGAAELEAKLSEVQAVSGATAEQLGLLRAAAEEAGASTKFSATEAAGALGELSRSGLDAQQAIAALSPTLALASAGGIDLGESASLVTKILAGFGFEATEAARVADVLAKGANASNTSVQGLGDALSYAAPTAVSMGMSLESVVAIIGKFADAGIDASRAGTALNSILAQFSDPASKFRAELAAAGITTTDFEKALRQLEAAGPAGQKAIAAVGLEAGPALKALLNQGIGSLDELKAKLLESAGAAKATADTMSNNLTGALSGLASAWDTVKNALATPVLPVLRDGVDQLTTALRSAVQDGTVGKFGTAIANGFQSALTWGRAFLAEVDFDALSAKVSGAADKVGAAFETLATYAKNTGNTVALIWGVMSAGANSVLAVVYTVAEAFALVARDVMTGIALLREGLAKISFGSLSAGFAEAARDARESAGAFGAAAGALSVKASQSAQAVADGAQTARDAWTGLTDAGTDAAEQATTSAKAFEHVGNTLTVMGDKASAAGQQTNAALADVGKQAQATQAEVAAAFERMGVQTQASLQQAANNALRDFDLIKNSGQATTDGLAKAWKQYAEAAIAANGGVATETLKAQAALQGLEVVVDATGKAIVRAMGSGADAADGYTRTITAATQAVQTHLTWLDRLEKRNAEVKSVLITDKEGFAADKDGKRIAAGGDLTTLTGINNFLKQAGLNDSQAKSVAREFADSQGNIPYFSNPGQMKYGGRESTISEALLKAAERTTFGTGGGTTAGAASVGRTVNVNINTPAGRETVATDEAGAAALVRSLQNAQIAARG